METSLYYSILILQIIVFFGLIVGGMSLIKIEKALNKRDAIKASDPPLVVEARNQPDLPPLEVPMAVQSRDIYLYDGKDYYLGIRTRCGIKAGNKIIKPPDDAEIWFMPETEL
jgi:hypothetical protein